MENANGSLELPVFHANDADVVTGRCKQALGCVTEPRVGMVSPGFQEFGEERQDWLVRPGRRAPNDRECDTGGLIQGVEYFGVPSEGIECPG